jgi:hypothetical protein
MTVNSHANSRKIGALIVMGSSFVAMSGQHRSLAWVGLDFSLLALTEVIRLRGGSDRTIQPVPLTSNEALSP